MALTLRRYEIQLLELPLLQSFGIAGGTTHVAANLLLRLELSDGTVGWGEAAPLPAYNGETQAAARAALERALPQLIGGAVDDWVDVARQFRALVGELCGSAQCAFETALLDALSRHEGKSLTQFFGGAGQTLETDLTITTGNAEEAATAAAHIFARGFRVIKVKLGGPNGVEADLARLDAVARAAPDARLILDANAALTLEQARALVAGLRQREITPALVEQWLPKDDLVGMHQLATETGWRLAADEAVVTPADALRVAHAGAAHVINIKLMKAGVAMALDVVSVARRCGLGLMIGGNVESSLGMTMSACFAAGLGGFEYADLDTPLLLASDPFEGGLRYTGASVSVAQVDAGHGVRPRPRSRE